MTRREFLKAVAGTALFFTARRLFPVNHDDLNYPDDSKDRQESLDVALVNSKDYVKGVEEAIKAIGGINQFVKPGDIVVVKPNMAFNSPPGLKANTDPIIVRTVIDLCYQALASKVYVFDRSLSNPKLSYVTSGIADAAKAAGAKIVFVNDISKKMYPVINIKDAHFLKETTVSRYILESDVLINVPVAKQHSSAGLTIGMKNLMGITGDNRSKWHWELHEAISDFNLGVRSNLTVVDATNLMIKNGPTGGSTDYLRRHDTVIASSNVLSADAVTAELFGIDPYKIGYIALGSEKGIGRIEGFSSSQIIL